MTSWLKRVQQQQHHLLARCRNYIWQLIWYIDTCRLVLDVEIINKQLDFFGRFYFPSDTCFQGLSLQRCLPVSPEINIFLFFTQTVQYVNILLHDRHTCWIWAAFIGQTWTVCRNKQKKGRSIQVGTETSSFLLFYQRWNLCAFDSVCPELHQQDRGWGGGGSGGARQIMLQDVWRQTNK